MENRVNYRENIFLVRPKTTPSTGAQSTILGELAETFGDKKIKRIN